MSAGEWRYERRLLVESRKSFNEAPACLPGNEGGAPVAVAADVLQ